MVQNAGEPRVALVTGGSRGIGAATVKRLEATGFRVASVSRTVPQREDSSVLYLTADVTQRDEVAAACATTVDQFGRLDLVVANAGRSHQGRLDEQEVSIWREVLQTNIAGAWSTVCAALPHLLKGRDPQIVVVGSVAGIGRHAGEPVYLASKWAVRGMALALRRDLREMGVRVALVEPGLTLTEMTQSAPAAAEWLRAVDPLLPEDVAELIASVSVQPTRVSVGELLVRPARQVV